jgi:hypothetical protein
MSPLIDDNLPIYTMVIDPNRTIVLPVLGGSSQKLQPIAHPIYNQGSNLYTWDDHDRYGKPQEVPMDEVRAMEDVAEEGEEGEGECEMCRWAIGDFSDRMAMGT